MSLHSLIANGGRVVVVGGLAKHFNEFREHPQLVFWSGERKDIALYVKNNAGRLPENTHGLILSRFLSHSETGPLMADARRKKATILPMKNDGEIKALLKEITTPTLTIKPKQETVMVEQSQESASAGVTLRPLGRGELRDFVLKHDNPNVIAARESARIHKLMTEAGFQTTKGSVEQCIRTFRKKLGIVGPRQKSVKTKQAKKPTPAPAYTPSVKPLSDNNLDGLLMLIKDTMAGLALIKDEAVALQKERADHARLRENIAKMIGA